MICGQMLAVLLYSLTSLRYVLSMDEPVITRDTYDLLHYPNCDKTRAQNFDCNEIAAERYGDRRLCRCKCKKGYLAYRDPAVEYNYTRRSYDFSEGTRKCVWHGLYREGCHFLRLGKKLGEFHAPTILDLTTSGKIVLSRESLLSPQQALCVQPFVHIPGENRWEKIKDIIFNLVPANERKSSYILSWSLQSEANIYAYQGLVIKLNFSECSQPIVFCLIAKAAGTYAGNGNCERRAVSGRCCIFPFVHKNVVYKDCASTSDMPGGKWCAVSLNNSVDEGNHKWREFCSTTSTTPSSETTKPLSRRPPIFHTPPPKRKRKTTSRQSTTQPHRAKKPMENQHPAGVIRTVTVTYHTCVRSSTRAVPTAGPGKGSGNSGVRVGMIVGILLGILVFLVTLALLVLYLRRKKTTQKRRVRPKKSVSREDLAESSYASIYSTMSARGRTQNHLNHGYQQSIELSQDQAAVVRRSYLRGSQTSSNSHFYDSIENKSPPNTQSSYPIYSMPEADYSLIIEKEQTKINKAPDLPPVLPVMLTNKRKNPNKHLYSVLERNNDPLKNPEPIDNDAVFVEANPIYASTPRYKKSEEHAESEGGYAEANPLYGTTSGFNRNNPPPLPPRLYDDPLEILPPKSEPPETNEKDV